ncbi:MAG: response regulator [Bacteroidales bacterium]|nr:response regulator [Bacteroidales bacterium]
MNPILVVDDEKSVRAVIKAAMEYYGYKVTVACNGKEGLEYFNHGDDIKLVITDINMPVMDGIELARAIRNSTKSNTPIIAMTAFPGNKDIEGDLFNRVIGKPFNLASLAKIIGQHLGLSTTAS